MSEFLETTVDKFTFRVATDRLYNREGLWVFRNQPQGGERVRVGLTDYLQQRSGDLAFLTVRPAGTRLQVGDVFAVMETLKATLDLASPVGGTIAAANDALTMTPELVNQSPYEKGWLAEIDPTDWDAVRTSLLDPKAYFTIMKAQAEEEAQRS